MEHCHTASCASSDQSSERCRYYESQSNQRKSYIVLIIHVLLIVHRYCHHLLGSITSYVFTHECIRARPLCNKITPGIKIHSATLWLAPAIGCTHSTLERVNTSASKTEVEIILPLSSKVPALITLLGPQLADSRHIILPQSLQK